MVPIRVLNGRIRTIGKTAFFTVLPIVVFAASITMAPSAARAQFYGNAIATTQHISGGTPQSGDVVSFNPQTNIFYLTRIVADKNIVGVVASNPILLLSGTGGGTPVVTSGQTVVNVSTANGPISMGDYLTSSIFVGVAEKASSTAQYIIGTALSTFPSSTTTRTATTHTATSSFTTGQVQVLLSIGPNPTLVAGITNKNSDQMVNTNTKEATAAGAAIIFRIVKYILAALITAGTIYVAFRTSKSAMNSSIISIGRNPLAKQSIRSILFADTAIIVLISVVGLAMALALVLMPV